MIGQKPPLKLREVWSIRIRLQPKERLRDLVMFNLAIDSKLRGSDLVALQAQSPHRLKNGQLGERNVDGGLMAWYCLRCG